MIDLFPSRAVAVELFGFAIHWYGIMYLLAFLTAYFVVQRIQKYRDLHLSADDWSTLTAYAVLGVLLGGRLGFVLFYEPAYFLQHPLEVFAVWRGGMSSHGGFIGVTLILYYIVTKKQIPKLPLADTVVVPIAIGLAFGRLGNFINLELHGTATTLPWGIDIPGVIGKSHPTQIYAIIKNLLVATICFIYLKKTSAHFIAGRTCALFLIFYAIARFIVEHFRFQQYPVWDIGIGSLTRGQILTIPVLLVGIIMWHLVARQQQTKESL